MTTSLFAGASLAACSMARDEPGEALARAASAISNAPGDTLESVDAVVALASAKQPATGNGANCTGTLISPRLVLTAAHCFGFDPSNRGLTGGDPSCTIEDSTGSVIASGGGCGVANFTHVDGNPTESAKIVHVWVTAKASPKGGPFGSDMALASLDRRATPLTNARAPSIPPWFQGDPGADHWKSAWIAYAGWGLTDGISSTCKFQNASRLPTHLSVDTHKMLDGDYPVNSDSVGGGLLTPMFIASFDLYGDSTGFILPGDSGGPLLSRDPTGKLSVIGVASGFACKDQEVSGTLQNLWTRTFNPDNATLLDRIALRPDGTLRGADRVDDDGDADGVPAHVSDEVPFIGDHDNCPGVYNPDQLDTDNDGIGDACEPAPVRITSLSPSNGYAGDKVYVSGFGMWPGHTSLAFGGSPVTDFSCAAYGADGATSCTVTVPPPPGASAAVDVVATVDGQRSLVTPADVFVYGPMSVDYLSRTHGPIAGGNGMYIEGAGFEDCSGTPQNMQVFFQRTDPATGAVTKVPAAQVICGNSSRLSLTTPAVGAPGAWDLVVTAFGRSSPLNVNDVFTYTAGPEPYSIGVDWSTGTAVGTLDLDGIATSPTEVALSSADPASIGVPATVIVSAGSSSVSFPMSGKGSQAGTEIQATRDGYSVYAYVTQAPPTCPVPKKCLGNASWDSVQCQCVTLGGNCHSHQCS